MISPFRFVLLPLSLIITLAALAFSAYVAIDEDLRTLVWDKWQQDVQYEFPGGDRNISIQIEVER